MEGTGKINRDKGFSLIELIISVMIMAIVMIAMAPQVMKWVNNARISTDLQTKESVISLARLAITESAAYDSVKNESVLFTIQNSGTALTVSSSAANIAPFATSFAQQSGLGMTEVTVGTEYSIPSLVTKTENGIITVSIVNGSVDSSQSEEFISADLETMGDSTTFGFGGPVGPAPVGVGEGGGRIPAPGGGGSGESGFKMVNGNRYYNSNGNLTIVVNSVSDLKTLNDPSILGTSAPYFAYVGFTDFVARGKALTVYTWDGISTNADGTPAWTVYTPEI